MRRYWFLALIISLLVLTGCSSGSDASPSPSPSPTASPATSDSDDGPVSTITPTTREQPTPVIKEIKPNPAYVGDKVTFEGAGEPADKIERHRWSIAGEGTISHRESFSSSLVTEKPGAYTIILEVLSVDGEWSSKVTKPLTVLPRPPSANFICQPVCGSIPLKVDFTNTTDKAVTERLWEFGDGYTSKAKNPSHTYVEPGIYTVTLTVEGPDGRDTKTRKDLIEVIEVDFTASPTTGYNPVEVEFKDLSMWNITSWAWDFGDGNTSSEQNPVHTYTSAGVYDVTLAVIGQSDTAVTKTRNAYINVLEPPPVADFYCHSSTYVGFDEQFTDLSQGTVTDWRWNFGDGTTSNLKNPTHSFAFPGTYTVRLTVEGPGGSDVAVRTITVEEWQGQ
ncbi:MAG: PKD domain-containing protein [Dehalococcoidia bacterium]